MIHHMLFIDDKLLVCKPEETQEKQMVIILDDYVKATGNFFIYRSRR